MEMVIRVDPRPDDTADRRAMYLSRGDVIDIRADGWGWSAIELSNPAWRMIRVTGMTQIQADALLAGEADPEELKPRKLARIYRIDLDHENIPAFIKVFLADNSREVSILDLSQYASLLDSLTKHGGIGADI
jgi:hypothetical protein